jgi:ABC-type Na+ efflux pump permease subunit
MTNKGSSTTVAWWVGWILLTILSFFVCFYFWTPIIAKHVGSMQEPAAPILWVVAVFGSWMVLLVPLIIVMYAKVDKAYEDARIARETAESQKAKESFKIKSILVEPSKRQLPAQISQKLSNFPETIRKGHLVTVILKNGQKFDNVFVLNKREILGLYGASHMSFLAQEVVDVMPVDPDKLPNFKTENWLRLDGVGAAS